MKYIFVPIKHEGKLTGSLVLLGYDQDGNILYRSSFNSQRKQVAMPIIHEGICYLGLYSFDEKYLKGLELYDNQINKK